VAVDQDRIAETDRQHDSGSLPADDSHTESPERFERKQAARRRFSGLTTSALRGWAVALTVLAVVLAGAAGFAAFRVVGSSSTDAAGQEALDAARTGLPLVLSYSARTLDANLGRAREQITGSFAEQFDRIAANVIAPGTRDQQITTTATVRRGAVISSTTDEVATLLFVDQSTTTTASPDPRQTTTQVRVTMSRVAGRWLISDVTQV
jgi:Mce-associated membrane protein